jgi:hypothetical protein
MQLPSLEAGFFTNKFSSMAGPPASIPHNVKEGCSRPPYSLVSNCRAFAVPSSADAVGILKKIDPCMASSGTSTSINEGSFKSIAFERMDCRQEALNLSEAEN